MQDDGSYLLSDKWRQALGESDLLIMQRDLPDQVNIAAATAAREVGDKAFVVLDMGGREEFICDELISLCDVIIASDVSENLFVYKCVG